MKYFVACMFYGSIFLQARLCLSIDIDELAKVSKGFYKEITLKGDPKRKIDSILYGNKKYGYYRTLDFKKRQGKIFVQLIPPGYKYPVSFYSVSSEFGFEHIEKLGQIVFKSHVPKEFNRFKVKLVRPLKGTNYVLLSGSIPKSVIKPEWVDPFDNAGPELKAKYRFSFLVIINRLGEIVWLHVPVFEDQVFVTYVAPIVWKKGIFASVYGKKAGFFEIVNFKGRVLKQLSSKLQNPPYAMHHDLINFGNRKILTIDNRLGQKPGSIFSTKKKTFLYNSVIEVDLPSGDAREVFNPLKIFSPDTTNVYPGPKRDKKFYLWGKEEADSDFTHGNWLGKTPGGYLYVLRNLNKIIHLSKESHQPIWTIGFDNRDTYSIPPGDSRFSHIHTPHLLGKNKILLFDNGTARKQSRIARYQLDREKGMASLEWTYTPKGPKLYSMNRGSVYPLANNNYIALFVSPIVGNAKQPARPNRDYLLEINPKTNKVEGEIQLIYQNLSSGYRAQPLDTIGSESMSIQNLEYNSEKENYY